MKFTSLNSSVTMAGLSAKVDCSRMHGFIADHPDTIKGLLNLLRKAVFDQRGYVLIQVVAWLGQGHSFQIEWMLSVQCWWRSSLVCLLELADMVETFRLKKSVKYHGMVFAAIFLAALVGYSSIFFLEEPAKHGFKGEHSVAIVGGMGLVAFGTMLLLSVYMWAAYYVESFTISGTTLWIRSMLQNHQFDVSELECLTWRSRLLGGSIIFRVIGAKSRLDLHGYANDDRLQIIKALHDLVPTSVQEGWPDFCHKVALPLRDGRPSLARSEPSSECFTITRRRYDRMAGFGFPLSIFVAITLWVWLNLWQFFALPPLVVAAWLLLRFNVPPDGRMEARLTSTLHGRAQLVGWGAIVSAIPLMVGLRFWGVEKSTACLIGCVVIGAAFPPMLYLLHKADKQRRIADEQAANSAPEQWLQGHSNEGQRRTDHTVTNG